LLCIWCVLPLYANLLFFHKRNHKGVFHIQLTISQLHFGLSRATHHHPAICIDLWCCGCRG
jgi:hypothetical protein